MRLRRPDLQLLERLASDFLLLSRDHIQELLPRSKRRSNQRLTQLVRAGFLSRRDFAQGDTPQPAFYYLGKRAIGVLEHDYDRPLLEERIRQAESAVDSHSRHVDVLNWIHLRFLRAPHKDYRLTLWADTHLAIRDHAPGLVIRPDAYLEYEKDGFPYAAFVEAERAPTSENRALIAQKLGDYATYVNSDSFHGHLSGDRMRVLFVTETQSRAHVLLELFPSDLFWVSTLDAFRSHGLFEAYWKSRGGDRALDDSPDHGAFAPDDKEPPDPPDPPRVVPVAPQTERFHRLSSEFDKYLEEESQGTGWQWLFIPASGVVGFLVGGLGYLVYKLGLEGWQLAAKSGIEAEVIGLIILAVIFFLVKIAP